MKLNHRLMVRLYFLLSCNNASLSSGVLPFFALFLSSPHGVFFCGL